MIAQAKKRSVQFVLYTFFITYTSWFIFMFAHFKTGVKVFDDSPLGLLMLIGLFAPSLVGLVMRFTQKPRLTKTLKGNALRYLPISLLLPIVYVAVDIGVPQWIENFLTSTNSGPTIIDVIQSMPTPLITILIAFAMSIIFGGIEEIGWRGYLLPQLLKFLKPGQANMAVAIIWTLWHMPLFFLPGAAQYQANIIIFTMGTITLSSMMTYVWLKTESILLAILIHTAFNTTAVLGFTGLNSWAQLIVSTALACASVLFLQRMLATNKTYTVEGKQNT